MTELSLPTIEKNRTDGDGERHERLRAWRGLNWPINQILLQSLVHGGRTDAEIGAHYGVTAGDVAALREELGI